MHKIFGTKENGKYFDREGAYLIPFRGDEIAVVKTPKGYFFLGGGLENGESHKACIERECLEETGYLPLIKEKICSAENYVLHPTIGYFHPIQTYYYGELLEKISEPSETDHVLCWVKYEELKGNMFSTNAKLGIGTGCRVYIKNRKAPEQNNLVLFGCFSSLFVYIHKSVLLPLPSMLRIDANP